VGGKVQLTIIRNQGTPEETVDIRTLEVKPGDTPRQDLPVLEVKLTDGRRREAAYVAPVANRPPADWQSTPVYNPDRVMNQLRAMADPQVVGFEQPRGGVAAPGVAAVQPLRPAVDLTPRAAAGDEVLLQTRVNSFVRNTVDLQAQAVLAQDRRSVRLSVTPVFSEAALTDGRPVVVNPVIPGGN
jgi:hypothetical protein